MDPRVKPEDDGVGRFFLPILVERALEHVSNIKNADVFVFVFDAGNLP